MDKVESMKNLGIGLEKTQGGSSRNCLVRNQKSFGYCEEKLIDWQFFAHVKNMMD